MIYHVIDVRLNDYDPCEDLLLKTENTNNYGERGQIWSNPNEVVSILALQDKRNRHGFHSMPEEVTIKPK